MKNVAMALLACVSAMSVWAQDPKFIGRFVDVTGLVTVSSGGQLSNVANGMPFAVGSRVITTSGGGATLRFDNGCEVVLKVNQSLTVTENKDCAALLASVQPVGVPPAPAVAAAGSSNLVPGLIFTGAAVVAIITSNRNNRTSGS